MKLLSKIYKLVLTSLPQVVAFFAKEDEAEAQPFPGPSDLGMYLRPEEDVLVDATYRERESGLPKRILPGETVQITSPVEWYSFKGRDFIIAPHIARFFDIASIKVGRDEQLFGMTPIMGSGFSASFEQRPALNMKECPSSLVITTTVRNVGTKPHLFKAFFVGEVPPSK